MALEIWPQPDARSIVPKGHVAIAQRFSVGEPCPNQPSPEGTAEGRIFQPSLRDSSCIRLRPNAEALGYFQAPLRDEIEMAVDDFIPSNLRA